MFSQHIARIARWTREPVTRPRWGYALGLLASVAVVAVGVAGYSLTRPARTDASGPDWVPIAVCSVSVPSNKPVCAPARQYGGRLTPSTVCRRFTDGSLIVYYPSVLNPFHCNGRRVVPGLP